MRGVNRTRVAVDNGGGCLSGNGLARASPGKHEFSARSGGMVID